MCLLSEFCYRLCIHVGGFICWSWIIVSDLFSPFWLPASSTKWYVYIYMCICMYTHLGNILRAITREALLCERRPRFQHALLLSHFGTVCLQPSDFQPLTWASPVPYLCLKMTRAQTHVLIHDLWNLGIQGGPVVKWLLVAVVWFPFYFDHLQIPAHCFQQRAQYSTPLYLVTSTTLVALRQ